MISKLIMKMCKKLFYLFKHSKLNLNAEILQGAGFTYMESRVLIITVSTLSQIKLENSCYSENSE